LDEAHPENACFSCIECGAIIEEKHRRQMLAGFVWRAHNPQAMREHRSFWIWSAYSLLQSWQQIAREWLKAKGDPASEKTFWNDTLGKAFETRGDGRPWEELAARAKTSSYQRGAVPKGAHVLTLGIDCQGDRVEWQLVGFGREHRRYVIDYGTIGKHIAEPDCQRNLDLLLERKWKNSFGRDIGISLAAIDAGYSTDEVLSFARKYPAYKLIAVRGAHGDAAPRIAKVQRERDEKAGTILKWSHRFFNVGVSTLKMSLYRDLMKDDPAAPGFVAFPNNCEDRFFQELVSETRVAHKRFGQIIWRWEKPDKCANECLDTAIYAMAAAIKHGVNWISDTGWAKLEAQYEGQPTAPPAAKKGSIGERFARLQQKANKPRTLSDFGL
jgi:phage terminase large subunit GpA-like protein